MPKGITDSLRNRLLMVVLLSTLSALVVAAGALLYYTVGTYRRAAMSDLQAQADILARNVGPSLAFDDPATAKTDLEALRSKRTIRAVLIFNRNGELFVGWNDDAALPRNQPIPDGLQQSGNLFQVAIPVMEADQRLGTVYLRGRYPVAQRTRDYALILAGISLVGLLIALAFSAQLQSTITRPVRALTEAADKVVRTHDFSPRVEKTTNDEIGVLVEAFNSMVTELGKRARAMEASDRQKDEFLATLAHELRNPLSPMVNAINMMERSQDAQLRDKARDILARQLKQMVRLVNDLLDMSRITTGKISVEMRAVDLRAVLANAIEAIAPVSRQLGHRLDIDLPDAEIWLTGDQARLTQVVTNILDNAVKYTPPGGEIALAVEQRPGSVLVHIRDSGIGIEPDKLEKIFEMFAQVDTAPGAIKSGLGVGLALARRLVEMHGGSISVQSQGRGAGTQFTITLPRQSQSPPVMDAPVDSPPASRPVRRILLVDDNVDHVQSLAVLLSDAGHEVRVVFDGASALELLRKWQPDLACLDIGMPEMDGYELAGHIRHMQAHAQMPLIAITGWGQPADSERARAAGFSHHLVKPVAVESLLDLIDCLRPAMATPA